MTIVQASIEIGILTNRVTSAPPMTEYSHEINNAPMFRGILDGILNRLPAIKAEYSPSSPAGTDATGAAETPDSDDDRDEGPHLLSQEQVVSLYPPVSQAHSEKMIAETLHALTAIGGHENPPARHIVGVEGISTVKEKLKTVSEELEEFVECSAAVDFEKATHSKIESVNHSDLNGTSADGDVDTTASAGGQGDIPSASQ
ncbi:MAG: hypothetical protein Q9160_006956 [Pyrenula sp. 1 TL-2023]